MRANRLGWPTTAALAVLCGLGLWEWVGQLTPIATGLFAILAAVALSWALDILLGAIGHYRRSTRPDPFGEVLRRYVSTRTPPTATAMRNVLVAIAAVAVVSATLGTGIAAIDTATPAVGGVSAGGAVSGFTSTVAEERVNETEVRQAMHHRINELRDERGVPPLIYSDQVAADAQTHTEWMATENELRHSDVEAQYACQEVGENIAYTYAGQDIATENGTVNYYGNETEIAHGIVRQWMNSERHRENLLDPSFSGQGIGVATNWTDDGQRVYATQALCN